MFIKMKVFITKLSQSVGITIMLLLCYVSSFGQATLLGTDAFTGGSYSTFSLSSFGKLRQYRDQALLNMASGAAKWEFLIGSTGSPDYSTNWRPYIGSSSIPAFDSIIDPSLTNGSARYNSSTGGSTGFLPAITAGRYYTFNIGDNASSNNYMSVWETSFNPAQLTVVTRSPTVVCAGGDSVEVTITSNKVLDPSEKAYIRYSSFSNFSTSFLSSIGFSGTNGSVKIPIPATGISTYYYVFTSKLTMNQLAPGGTPNQTYCDIGTLSINNNSNSNYTFVVITSPLPNVAFSVVDFCTGAATTFTNSSSISSGSISNYLYTFGDGHTSTSSAPSVSNTYLLAGTYNASLKATSNLGCQKTATQNIVINQTPSTSNISAY
jgi:hypothetical protein